MRFISKMLAIKVILGGFALSCSEEDSKPHFSIGHRLVDATRGHEDLTRFAVNIANQYVAEHLGMNSYFTSVPHGENAGDSTLPIIRGSFHTDWAISLSGDINSQYFLDYYGVPWLTKGTEWQDQGDLQSLHFLREQTIAGAVCKSARKFRPS